MPNTEYLLFDLDSTLYTDTTGLFTEVGNRIESWLTRALALSLPDAQTLRRDYFVRHGTTMAGLLQEHPHLDIEDYLDYVHDIDVTRYLPPNPALDAMLARLLAPKSVFTNSVIDWAERITRHLGIRHHFEHIIGVRAVDYQSKPSSHAYRRALAIIDQPPEAVAMIDDQVSYLRGAAALGMRTLLVHPDAEVTDGINAAVATILETEPILQSWLR